MAEAFSKLYGPDGRAISDWLKERQIDKGIMTQEIAGASVAGIRSPLGANIADGMRPERLGAIMRMADHGTWWEYLDLAEQIEERDMHYLSVLRTRKVSVSRIPIHVEAAGSDKASQEQADLIEDWLTRDMLKQQLFHMLDAVGKGVSFTEIIWDTSEGQWDVKSLKWQQPRYFRPDRIDLETPMLRDTDGDKPLPPAKFIFTKVAAKSGLAIRSGLARAASFGWMWKKYTERDWALFCQAYYQPLRLGKFKAGATEDEKRTLLKAVTSIAADAAAVIPDSMAIEFVGDTQRAMSGQSYKERCDWIDQQISKLVVGQTTTTDAVSGGHAVSREHRAVQKDIAESDADVLQGVINTQLVRSWIDLQFGPQKKYPRVIIEEPDDYDIQVVSNALGTLVPLGLRVAQDEIRDKLGFSDPDDDDEILKPQPSASQPPTKEKLPGLNPQLNAAGDLFPNPDLIDELEADATADWKPSVEPIIKQVRKLLASCQSLEEFKAKLPTLARGLDVEFVAAALTNASLVAEMAALAGVPNKKT